MITIKTPEEIEIMRDGGKILAEIMEKLKAMVRPGITTQELNKVAEALILKSGAKCSFLGYQGYPACLCASINEQIVHVVPSERILKEGDIISLDLGLLYQGFHSDMAITVPVGNVSPKINQLIQATKESLNQGIKAVMPGKTFIDVSKAIQKYIESRGFSAVRDLCGHGIGRELHEDPEILNYLDKRSEKTAIKEGMVFCLEPMVAIGAGQIKKSQDGYGYETADGSLSCHFEHMMAVTKNGANILTV